MLIKAFASGGKGSNKSSTKASPKSIPSKNRRTSPAVYNPPVQRSGVTPITQYHINSFAGAGGNSVSESSKSSTRQVPTQGGYSWSLRMPGSGRGWRR